MSLEDLINNTVDKAVAMGIEAGEEKMQAKYDSLKASHDGLVEACEKVLGMIYSSTHPMPKAEISTLLSQALA